MERTVRENLSMLSETAVALFLFIWLVIFSAVNLHNILRTERRRSSVRTYAEVERPAGLLMALAALGTLVYFVAVFVFIFFAFVGLGYVLVNFSLGFPAPFAFYFQLLGMLLTALGYLVFVWSVIVRGKYSVSWAMPEHQKLVTWGPYRYVRHPSYLGYFLMFIGLFLLWPALPTLFPIVAIPGYYRLTFEEERLLEARFGEEYQKYQKRTGRFVPKLG